VALPWLVLSGLGGAVSLGIVMACYGVARTGTLAVGGALADKIGPRITMLSTDVGRMGLLAALALVSASQLPSLPVLCSLAALLGGGSGFFYPASMSIMPTWLIPDQLQAGNALFSAATQGGTFLGPVAGGVLIATAGPAPAFAVDAVTFAVSAVTLALMGHRAPVAPKEPGTAEHPAGVTTWTLLRRWRALQLVLLEITVATLAFGGLFEIALPALAHLRFGAAAYGALMTSLGAGSVAGTLAATRAGSLSRPMIATSAAFLAEAAAISLVPFLGGLAGALAATAVYGACNGFGNVVFLTALQRSAPAHLRGQVMSLILLANWGTFPLAVAAAGLAVHRLGPAPYFPIAAIALVVPKDK
jgi:MFS family permease